MPEEITPPGLELPNFDPQKDVLVIPLDFDSSTLSQRSQIALQLLDELGKVIRISTLRKVAVMRIY